MDAKLQQKLNSLPHSPEGHWGPAHLDIIRALKEYDIKTMLEIGFNNGYSATGFLTLLDIEKFYSLDIGIHDFVAPLQSKFKAEHGDKFYPYISDSMKIRETPLNDLTYDLIFIDGGHKFPVALNDFQFSVGKCKYILLDDTKGASPGVTDLITFINKGDGDNEPLIGNKVELIKTFAIGSGSQLYKCI